MIIKRVAIFFLVLVSYKTFSQATIGLNLSDSAHIFGAGVISSGDNEFNASFTPDGKTVFFSKAGSGWSYIAIYSSTKKNGVWGDPEAVSFTGIYRDTDPFVSADGSKLYFMSDRPTSGKPFTNFDYNIYSVSLKGSSVLSEPVLLDIPYQGGLKGMYPSVAANGNIYFLGRKDNDADIYVSRFVNGKYAQPESLSFNDKSFNDIDPFIAKDESFIVFVSVNRKGYGGNDLWISFKNTDNTWSDPINLGNKINTAGHEGAPGLSADNKKLYFSAYREKIDRELLSKEKDIPKNADRVLHSFRNGYPNIYEIDISDIIRKK